MWNIIIFSLQVYTCKITPMKTRTKPVEPKNDMIYTFKLVIADGSEKVHYNSTQFSWMEPIYNRTIIYNRLNNNNKNNKDIFVICSVRYEYIQLMCNRFRDFNLTN